MVLCPSHSRRIGSFSHPTVRLTRRLTRATIATSRRSVLATIHQRRLETIRIAHHQSNDSSHHHAHSQATPPTNVVNVSANRNNDRQKTCRVETSNSPTCTGIRQRATTTARRITSHADDKTPQIVAEAEEARTSTANH